MADRQIVYTDEVPFETDVLNTNKFSYVGQGRLLDAIIGATTQANGFNTVPTTVPSLSVDVEQGEIYEQNDVDTTDYGVLLPDTSKIIKQGIFTGPINLSTPAAAGGGNSVDYLVQVDFVEADINVTNRPYFNSADPSTPIFQNAAETRSDTAVVTIKAGIEAPTGTQVPPSPDAGNVGLFVVTVDNGQTEVLAPDITLFPGTPLIGPDDKLKDKAGINKTQVWTAVQEFKISYCEVNSTTQQVIPHNTVTKLAYNATPVTDNDNYWNAGLLRFEPKRTGLFRISVHYEGESDGIVIVNGISVISILLNGVTSSIIRTGFDFPPGPVALQTHEASTDILITTLGDFVEVEFFQNYDHDFNIENTIAKIYYLGQI